jgi:hypothetical protein
MTTRICFGRKESCLGCFFLLSTSESRVTSVSAVVTLEDMFQTFSSVRWEDMPQNFQKRQPRTCHFPLQVSIVPMKCIDLETEDLISANTEIELLNTSSIEIWKISSETYLLSFVSWERVKYLKVSNVEGFLSINGGLLIVPSLSSTLGGTLDASFGIDNASMLRQVANQCLWTDGIEIRYIGSHNSSEVWYDELHEAIPSISFNGSLSLEEAHPPCSDNWRTCIERTLQHSVQGQTKILHEQELQAKRRSYIFQRSLDVLDELLIDEKW